MKTSLKTLPTVGKKRAIYLNELGIYDIEDILYYLPREVQDRRGLSKFSVTQQLTPGQKLTVAGKVIVTDVINLKNNLGVFKAVIETIDKPSKIFTLCWYKKLNRKYDVFSTLKKQFESTVGSDKVVIAYGRVSDYKARFTEVNVEDYEILPSTEENTIHTNRLVPVYTLNEHLSQQWYRELVYYVLKTYKVDEYLPKKILEKEKLLNINFALENAHFPQTWQLFNEAKKRLLFDKFLFLQLAVLKVKKKIISKPKVGKYTVKRCLLTPFKERLKGLIPNFDFTRSQKRVINELFRDMLSPHAMNRLLIGEVGSGKTIVAVSCALLAVENGYQVAFMAPTEILAEQHYFNLMTYVKGLHNEVTKREVKIALLIGKISKKQKEKILKEIADGEIDIVVGTHALIEGRVKFKNLSFVIVDEQHRFGVLQRKKLYEKSLLPDVLIMTATPIPRSLAMTLYGELDISIINELPVGRKPVTTLYFNTENYDYSLVLERLRYGEKAYIVYPIIEETKFELKTLVDEYDKLSKTIFKNFSCGLLHGKLSSQEKQSVMQKFKSGEYQVLFCTTVIEVGIDVPDATVIVINHAERYGLAQLHQLRGRVGRSDRQSYCILLGKPNTEEAQRRIEIMLKTNNGFEIANEDLLLRGPGNIFGTSQHGKTEFDTTEVLNYTYLLLTAKDYAKKIIFSKEFSGENLNLLFKKVYSKYAKDFDLAPVG
ncbi:MAG: ATP-dependent DNA helicase RecG [Endomicrobia bacterium]|nr:ATP-dependent DNA helicase RecG [Endomicrobiia bacterium]MDW8055449.1 ATP-dependent DNA helicase RecG [Elusimicrobiota bacterium]